MERRIFTLLFSLFLILGFGYFEQIYACWCRHVTDCEAVNRSETAFVGTVIDIKPVDVREEGVYSFGPRETIRFQIDEPFFGTKTKQITIHTGSKEGSDCDYFPFHIGESYVVFAFKYKDNNLHTGLCGGTKPFLKAEKTLEYLRSQPNSTNNGSIYGDVHGVKFDKKLGEFQGTFLNNIQLNLTGNGLNKTIFTAGELKWIESGELKWIEFGEFSINNLKAGKYRLQVHLPSYYGFKYKDDGFVRDIKLNGRGCSQQDFFADVENSIEGTVTDRNGEPLKEVEVSLVPATKREDDTASDNYSVWTDSNGRFLINYIFPRDYYLGINIVEPDDDEEECDEDEECEEEEPQPATRLYYPNTADKAKAKSISFGLGQKYTGYNLVLEKNRANK